MKIVTWNINGIRTFKGSIKNALDSLDADVICVQETKVTRDLLDERTAIVEGYNSYYSFSRGRSGYSGVATYCKDSATPFAAEEGLAGLMTNYQGAVGCYGDYTDFSVEELQLLDNEGRAVVTQHQITFQNKIQTLTVINVYCPRADPDKPERKQFKLQFYKLLQARAEAILVSGSHVIVLGDVNTSHRPLDHCDPNDIDHFEENPGRKWLNEFLYNDDDVQRRENIEEESVASTAEPIHIGKFIDTFRYFHPSRTNAFTCWSTLTGARQTNYGTRIDYIFSDLLLAKQQFVAADIMPEVEGSDHCPVWGQLSCSLLPSSKPPPLCTCYLPEFAGKQQKLSRFLVKLGQPSVENEASHQLPGSQEVEERRENVIPAVAANMSGRKRTLAVDPVVPKGKKIRLLKTSSKLQGSLLAFFKPKPTNAVPATEAPASQCERLLGINSREEDSLLTERNNRGAGGTRESVSRRQSLDSMEKDRDKRTQMESECLNSETSAGPSGQKTGTSQEFWKSVFHGPPPPPPCKVHREPCVLRTVRKEGPNMGRQFFVCARPQGHASNPEARCNFFAWVDHGK